MTQAVDILVSLLVSALRSLPDNDARNLQEQLLRAAESLPSLPPVVDQLLARWLAMILGAVGR